MIMNANNCTFHSPGLQRVCGRYWIVPEDLLQAIHCCHQQLSSMLRIFQKLFTLFEEACHQLDLKLAMHRKEDSINSSEYEAYSSMLSNLSAAKCELDSLMQEEEIIQQVACVACKPVSRPKCSTCKVNVYTY